MEEESHLRNIYSSGEKYEGKTKKPLIQEKKEAEEKHPQKEDFPYSSDGNT